MLIMLEGNYFPFENAMELAIRNDTVHIASVVQLCFKKRRLFFKGLRFSKHLQKRFATPAFWVDTGKPSVMVYSDWKTLLVPTEFA